MSAGFVDGGVKWGVSFETFPAISPASSTSSPVFMQPTNLIGTRACRPRPGTCCPGQIYLERWAHLGEPHRLTRIVSP